MPSADFGDNWNDKLDAEEGTSRYFQAIGHLVTHPDYIINLRVTGQDHAIRIDDRKYNHSVTFEGLRNC